MIRTMRTLLLLLLLLPVAHARHITEPHGTPRHLDSGWYFKWYDHDEQHYFSGPYPDLADCREGLRRASKSQEFKHAVVCYYHERRG